MPIVQAKSQVEARPAGFLSMRPIATATKRAPKAQVEAIQDSPMSGRPAESNAYRLAHSDSSKSRISLRCEQYSEPGEHLLREAAQLPSQMQAV